MVIIPKAVWDREERIRFQESGQNSGRNSAVMPTEGTTVEVAATTIDRISKKFGRIDYIKMDIESAERKALAGARSTLQERKPRLAIEVYHLRDDAHVVPSIILAVNPGYSLRCGPCAIVGDRAKPYIIYGR